MHLLKYIIPSMLIILTFSCQEKEVSPEKESVHFQKPYILILNEGNFMWSNSSISVLKDGKIFNNVFENVNGKNLGDVLQSAINIQGKWYLILNNSGKIEIVDDKTFSSIGKITGLFSPRYLYVLNSNNALVTNMYVHKLQLLDLNQNKVINEINTTFSGEEMVEFNDKIYITAPTKNYVYLFDKLNYEITDSIKVRVGGESILNVSDSIVIAYCSGSQNHYPTLYFINSSGKYDSLEIPEINHSFNTFARKSNYNNDILINVNGLYKMNYKTKTINKLISENCYGFGSDDSKNIYISDSKDFNSKGSSEMYNSNGNFINTFETGLIPSEQIFSE